MFVDNNYVVCYTLVMDKIDFEYKINSSAYNESFARYLVERVYVPEFKYASVQDKPDIWNTATNHGIEVTTLTNTYYNTLNRYRRVWAEKKLTLEQIIKQQPTLLKGKLGINKHGNIILLNLTDGKKSVARSQKGLASTVALKLRKLKNYEEFATTDLFIFAPDLHGACTTNHIKDAIYNIEKLTNVKLNMFDKLYDNILVFTYTNLIVVPFKEKTAIKVINVTPEDRDYCDKFANIAMEKSEKNRKQLKNKELEQEL